MSLASYIAHLRRVVKATVTLLMLSLLSSPCPSEEHGRCEACSTKAQKVRWEGLGLSHSDPKTQNPFGPQRLGSLQRCRLLRQELNRRINEVLWLVTLTKKYWKPKTAVGVLSQIMRHPFSSPVVWVSFFQACWDSPGFWLSERDNAMASWRSCSWHLVPLFVTYFLQSNDNKSLISAHFSWVCYLIRAVAIYKLALLSCQARFIAHLLLPSLIMALWGIFAKVEL